ncbi:CBS domain-containing protein [Pseudodesulfovibrio senegalensis]|uniref:CBS domain-containing protein n=1 Tax=Pseudodesulfovibrio senegalensis TaxID=1721087 RepID=A0A6N6N6E7_9BACT|nr:CBS domain-containing protein [Pseudodesulfovibrio senegalensis]KAB1443820.1 CBS domain-containing protein [Pseudodesulfovibrio senegalensis]
MNKSNGLIQAHTVITAHANADFDALAAMVGASKLYPDSVLIFPGSQEKNLRNFYIQSMTYLFNFKNFKEIDSDSVRLLVVVDTRQRSRLPHVRPLLDRDDITIHTYDHHPDSDEDLVAHKSVFREWGSCAAIMVHEMREQDIELNGEEATALGLGIFEDTGSFSFSSTTSHDFAAAAWLREQGMDLEVIADLLSRELSAEHIGYLGQLLNNATTHDIHGVELVITEISTDTFIPDFAFLVHKMMDVEDIRVLFCLGRMGDRIHVVARSKNPDVNVGQICSSLGGGGHAYAASATVKDKTLSEVRDDLFALFYSQINPRVVVKGLMSAPPKTIERTALMDDAVQLMTRYGLKGVPVVDEDGRCVGLLEHKIADKAVGHGLGSMRLSEYMITNFQTVQSEADLYQVMEIILGKRQRMLPVLDGDQLVGVITRTDLVHLLVEEPARMPETLLSDQRRERNISSHVRNRLPEDAVGLLREAGNLAQELGWDAYAVGGFVRDILLGRPNLDIDLVVEGDGIAFASALVERLGGRIKAHKKFKTAVCILDDGRRVDVATARLEYYQYPAALPTVELSSIKMDLYRRDFTMNALALRLNPGKFGQLVDFFGAERDIKNKQIRVLHSLSFVEDPTRILRAVRFEQRFGFRIGGQTMRLVKNALQLNLFEKLSGSRITHELRLVMDEENPLNVVERMNDLGLLKAIHPLLKLTHERVRVLQELEKVFNWYKLLYLDDQADCWKLYFLGLTMGTKREELSKVADRLNFSRREERELLALRDQIGDALMRLMGWQEGKTPLSRLYSILTPIPLEGVLFLMARSRKESIRRNISQYLARLRYVSIDVSGDDLIEMGIPEGPVFTLILDKILAARVDGNVGSREEQLAMALRLKKQFKSEWMNPV